MKILFLGQLGANWKSGWQRWQAMRELGHEIVPFAQDEHLASAAVSRITRMATGTAFSEEGVERFNQDLLACVTDVRPDVVWAEWPVLLKSETVELARANLPHCRWVCYQHDNPFGARVVERPYWRLFIEAIPAFDVQFVKRDSDLAAFRARGARRVAVLVDGFYGPLFRPLPADAGLENFRATVSFVGTALDHRVSFLRELLGRHRVPVTIYGNKWKRTRAYFMHPARFCPPVLGEDYVRVINGSQVNLGFVSSSNGDEYTMRTFEIPACRAFFLAERTPKHQEFFEEGREAEFFDSVEECADKIQFYLAHEAVRKRVAEGGYQRCLRSKYTWQDRLSGALKIAQDATN